MIGLGKRISARVVLVALVLLPGLVAGEQFIDVTLTDTITIEKLKRMVGKDFQLGEVETAHRVVHELARTMDKHVEKVFADRYSVYDLLDLNHYETKHLKYCAKGTIEARLDVCQDLKNNDLDNLFQYCSHVTGLYFEMCNQHQSEIINVIVDSVPDLKWKKIKEFSDKLDKYILKDGDEDDSDQVNIKGFLDKKEAKDLSTIVKETCKTIVKDFDNVIYFDENAQMTVGYLSRFLPEKQAKPMARCKSYLDVV